MLTALGDMVDVEVKKERVCELLEKAKDNVLIEQDLKNSLVP
jgi:hypothetical protein